MQLGVVQFLLGINPAATSASGEGAGDDLFSQLLGDASAQSGSDQQAAGGLLASDLAANALIAQELNPEQLAALQRGDLKELSQLLAQPIGPKEARALLSQLDDMQADHSGQDEAFNQLKEALEEIEANGETVEVAELLESLPVVEHAESPAQRAPLMQRMLGWMHGALDKQKEASQLAAAGAQQPDALAQSLQATLFRAGDDAPEIAPAQTDDAAETAPQETHEIADITVITPLAQTQLVAMPEWVRKLGEDTVPAEIDAAIPALALAEDESLPVVSLPGAEDRIEVADDDSLAVAEKPATHKTTAPTFSEHLKALPEHMTQQQAADEPVTQVVDATGMVQNGQGVQVASSHSSITVQTHSAVSHLATHTAAAEQVQVAITTAKQDGLDTITMQLEPADLGRVEVRMETGLDGRTQLSFLVDKAETMDALARDARSLERSLQEAGIKADAGSMQFNLRQEAQPQFTDNGGNGKSGGKASNDNDILSAVAPADGITTHYTINVREGVDIHA